MPNSFYDYTPQEQRALAQAYMSRGSNFNPQPNIRERRNAMDVLLNNPQALEQAKQVTGIGIDPISSNIDAMLAQGEMLPWQEQQGPVQPPAPVEQISNPVEQISNPQVAQPQQAEEPLSPIDGLNEVPDYVSDLTPLDYLLGSLGVGAAGYGVYKGMQPKGNPPMRGSGPRVDVQEMLRLPAPAKQGALPAPAKQQALLEGPKQPTTAETTKAALMEKARANRKKRKTKTVKKPRIFGSASGSGAKVSRKPEETGGKKGRKATVKAILRGLK